MLIPPVAAAVDHHQIPFFIGTYTSPKGSQGIYVSNLNTKTGEISIPRLCATSVNPSFLAFHPNRRYLYAVHESDHGSVSAYAIGKHHTLKLLNTETVSGGAPCHLSVDPWGRNLLVASYTGGFVTCLPIRSNGYLKPASSTIRHEGSGPDKSRQEAPHAHWIATDSSGKIAYTCDLGIDKVQAYRLKSRMGKLIPEVKLGASTSGGDGPRHASFHPNHRFLYVNGEMGDDVNVFRIKRHSKALTLIQQISSIPVGFSKIGTTTAEIQCHPTGKWLYVSTRGADLITVYRILKNGTLKLLQMQKAGVKMPRGFEIEPRGRWMVVAGQTSNDLVSFRIDSKTGLLHANPFRTAAPTPVCIAF